MSWAVSALGTAGAVALIGVVLWDAFETIILPRRIPRRLRLARFFYRSTWIPWSALARRLPESRREGLLSVYGPLSLLLLIGMWGAALVLGFAGLHWGLGTELDPPDAGRDFGTLLYMSGSNFFTLGIGDVAPRSGVGRFLTVVEAGTGLGFLAVVIGYLPVLYQAFSRRELNITLLDARAGAPPSAAELLRRVGQDQSHDALAQNLQDWERWAAELLETHLSYPVLAYYRSQHDHQSWLAALTTILDACALVMVGVESLPSHPAQLTFAMARHAVIDLTQVFGRMSRLPEVDRLTAEDLAHLSSMLASVGIPLAEDAGAERRLAELRNSYEPYVAALSSYLLFPLPGWLPSEERSEPWFS